eukprot:COSAG04_NODE_12019_length_675_cov_1.050347_2_plen_159_part_00
MQRRRSGRHSARPCRPCGSKMEVEGLLVEERLRSPGFRHVLARCRRSWPAVEARTLWKGVSRRAGPWVWLADQRAESLNTFLTARSKWTPLHLWPFDVEHRTRAPACQRASDDLAACHNAHRAHYNTPARSAQGQRDRGQKAATPHTGARQPHGASTD